MLTVAWESKSRDYQLPRWGEVTTDDHRAKENTLAPLRSQRYGYKGACREGAATQDYSTERANKIVLLVEDDPVMADLIVHTIGSIAEEVVVVRDGVEALDYLFCTGPYDERDPSMPRVVLMDLNMPQMGGLDALGRLRFDERTRLLPVVMFTSSNQAEDLAESYALGANGYVHRASASASLPELTRLTARFWLEANEPPYG